MVVVKGNISKLLETHKAKIIIVCYNNINKKVQLVEMKTCCKCKNEKSSTDFGNLKSSPDGLRYDCNQCRKEYRIQNKESIKTKQHEFYVTNKLVLLEQNKSYREQNKDTIKLQRKKYREQPEIKAHIAKKNKEYLPIKKESIKEKRQTDLNFRLSEVLRSKIHKLLRNQTTSYINVIGCDIEFFKKWISFRFDENMNWSNFGTYWQFDHIIPISKFDIEKDKHICFHWTNLQPLQSKINREKSAKIEMHYYFNNLVNVIRFNNKHKQFIGYQNLNESLNWLRNKLRYGNNPLDESVKTTDEIGNQQPSL